MVRELREYPVAIIEIMEGSVNGYVSPYHAKVTLGKMVYMSRRKGEKFESSGKEITILLGSESKGKAIRKTKKELHLRGLESITLFLKEKDEFKKV